MSARRFRINSPAVIHDTIDGEVVVIDFDTGSYYSLQGASAYVWQLLDSSKSEDEIVRSVEAVVPRTASSIGAPLDSFLTTLAQEHLIVPLPGDAVVIDSVSVTPVLPISMNADEELFTLQKFTDMNQLLLLDPIHEVDEAGWPHVPLGAHASGTT